MNKFIPAFICMAVLLIGSPVASQNKAPVQFSFHQERINKDSLHFIIKAAIQPSIRLYDLQKNDSDVLYSSIQLDSSASKVSRTEFTSVTKTKDSLDELVGASARYFIDSAIWQQTIQATERDSFLLKGLVNYIFRKGDEFISAEESFKLFIRPEPHSRDKLSTETTHEIAHQSLWWIFLASFGGGLLALFTPCVYSMIPVTVSFFTKRSLTKKAGIRNALFYALSIISIFTLLGFLITLLFGPAALNTIATNWIANLVFFVLFILFGISFLGAFDISLPSSWMNKSDSKAGTGSFWGIFFMALTLVLVSFSCTGPIIGNLLVLAAKGNYFGPLTGMFGFSLALALPFALFAFFPSKLNMLGKAGGWLNAVKVTLGFLELALALKFLSNADLVKGWRLLDRELFISLWVVLFLLLGLYLLGKLKFSHDDELPKNDFGIPYLSVTRFVFAIVPLSFAIYMIPGLWGAPLKGISAFLPPMGTQDFNAALQMNSPSTYPKVESASTLPRPVKYYEAMKVYEPEVVVTNGMITYFDYDEALTIARRLKKPLMLDFTGINCVNCRKMEGQVWSDPEVMQVLKEDFIIVSLYVDVQNIDLQEDEQYYSTALGKKVETLGDKNAAIQVTRFGANSQPYYFFLDGNEKRIVHEGYGYDADIKKFLRHVKMVKERYQSSPL